jgi:hypothetical protein
MRELVSRARLGLRCSRARLTADQSRALSTVFMVRVTDRLELIARRSLTRSIWLRGTWKILQAHAGGDVVGGEAVGCTGGLAEYLYSGCKARRSFTQRVEAS